MQVDFQHSVLILILCSFPIGRRSDFGRGGKCPAAAQVRQIPGPGHHQRGLRRHIPSRYGCSGSPEPRTPVGTGQLDLLGAWDCRKQNVFKLNPNPNQNQKVSLL